MTLAVVTLTAGNRPEYLAQCAASVRSAIAGIDGAEHVVMTATGDLEAARWHSIADRSEDFVAAVDDDDRLLPGALALCLRALEARPEAGLAFTYEVRIDAAGKRQPWAPLSRMPGLAELTRWPNLGRHLAVVRPSMLDPQVYAKAQEIGAGVDWLMRSWLAAKHGAVFVPVIGYECRSHGGQLSVTSDWITRFVSTMPRVRAAGAEWLAGRDAPIPVFDVNG